MTHEELKDKLLKAMGGKVPIGARETWGKFQRTRASEFYMNYDWVKVPEFWPWLRECKEATCGLGGSQGSAVWITKFGCVGHDK